MRTLLQTLLDYDGGLLAIIANRWDVDLAHLEPRDAAESLAVVMLDPKRAAGEWARLADNERGALQTLLGSADHKMAEAQFLRLFGEIRQMGPGRRDREKPHLNPVGVAEVLYFRGLIATGVAQGKTGMQPFVYVPSDLAAALPAHETGFDLEAEPLPVGDWEGIEPSHTIPATTTLVDDLTTLLAYVQITEVPSDVHALHQQVTAALADHWLGGADPARVALLISLAGSMGLATSEDGLFKPVPARARHWLEQSRPRQVRALAEAWRSTTLFNDLWHTPGLLPEDTGWRNDPLLARQTVLTFLEMVPLEDWWPVGELVAMVKIEEPDFQRPGGDYESWYIRDAASGQYVRGFEHWDQVDGAVLHFILAGPMHWLGLVDVSNDGDGGAFCRLTVYGRAFCGHVDWPDPPEETEPLTVQSDGIILAPRTVSRYERFQVARITEWVVTDAPYTYSLTANGLQRAAQQGIEADAIRAFLRRSGGHALADSIDHLLDRWAQGGQAEAWLTHAVVLRTESPETMRTIQDTPDLRRYLGAALGPTAVLVRAGQEADLFSALQHHGILVDWDD
ncbi:MAG: helicase-associated domain-containing protein [Anaerolineae bacterium]|nr:helicase-associated domain-containing protein [Anaerolineae bacterium]